MQRVPVCRKWCLQKGLRRVKRIGQITSLYVISPICVWGVSQLNYLGLLISEKKVSVAEKIAALREYEVPKTIADVRRFLGFAQYLAMFIPHFAAVTAPVQCLLEGNDKRNERNLFGLTVASNPLKILLRPFVMPLV